MKRAYLLPLMMIPFLYSGCEIREDVRVAGPSIEWERNEWLPGDDLKGIVAGGDGFFLRTVINAPAGLESFVTTKIGGLPDPQFPVDFFEEFVPGVIQSRFSAFFDEEEIGETIIFRLEAEDKLGQKSTLEVELEVVDELPP